MTYSIVTRVDVYFSVFITPIGVAVNFVAVVNIGADGRVGEVRYIDDDIEMGEVDDDVEMGEVDEDIEIGEADEDVDMGEADEDIDMGDDEV